MVDRFEDIYEFNVRGDFEGELRKLTGSLEKARGDWKSLQDAFKVNSGAKEAKKEVRDIYGTILQSGEAAEKSGPKVAKLAQASTILRNALNALVREQNRLNSSRTQSLIALDQARKKTQPAIIQARAEARALRRLAAALEEKAEKERFAQLAAEAGFKVSADGKRLFDAEAKAAEIAAKAQERLATARALAARGLDAKGEPLAPKLSPQQQLQADAKGQISDEIARLKLEEARLALEKTNPELKEMRERVAAARKELRAMNKTADASQGAFNRISFTFRRLIGIMAAFTVARVVVRSFNQMIAGAIRFRANLEQTRVGLAGLIAAAADIRPISGEQVGIDEKLRLSQDIAIDQMEKLKREALETAATYEDLAFAFQTAIAPGLQANLTLDQIREITVDISQAGTALGVAQNQLAEEIRSLFQGTITPRNTRIATALGISNEDIRRAKEAGQLAQFLKTRFEAISKQGEALMNTFNGALSNAEDVFKQLLSEASGPLFEQLKSAIKQVTDSISNTDKADEPFVKPEAVKILSTLFQGLANGVASLQQSLKKVNLDGVRDAASALGQGLGLAISTLGSALVTAFNVATPFLGILSKVFGVLNDIVTAAVSLGSDSGIGKFALLMAQVLVTLIGLRKGMVLLVTLTGGLGTAWKFIKSQVIATEVASAASIASTTRLGKAARLVGLAFKKATFPILIIFAILKGIDYLTEKLSGESTDFIGKIAGFLGDINDQVDRLIFGADAVEESATEKTGERVGQVVNDFRELRSELAALSNDLDRELSSTVVELSASLRGLAVPSGVAAQLRTLAESQNRVADQSRDARAALDDLERRSAALTAQVPARVSALQAEVAALKERRLETTEQYREELKSLELRRSLLAATRRALDPNLGKDEARDTARAEVDDSRAVELRRQRREEVAEQLKLETEIASLQGELKANEEQIALVKEKIAETTSKIEAIESRRLLLQTQTILRQGRRQLNERIEEAAAAQSEITAILTGNEARAESVRLAGQLASLQRLRIDREGEIQSAIEETNNLQQNEVNKLQPDLQLIVALDEQRALLQDQLVSEKAINDATVARISLEKRLADLRDKGGAFTSSGEDPSGFTFGLNKFAQANQSSFDLGQRFGQDVANGVTEFAASAISQSAAAAFDPNRNFDLREAAGNFLLSLGTNLLTDFLKSELSSLILDNGIGALTDSGKNAAELAQAKAVAAIYEAAALSMTGGAASASSSVSGVLSSASAAMVNAVGVASAAALKAISAAQLASAGSSASGLALGGRSDSLIGNRATAAHRGAPGFAIGGRPRGLDPRDTIPAWLRPGEWVIRPEAVRKYGDGLFSLLNRGRLNPDLFKGLHTPVVKQHKVGFATGGAATSKPRVRRGGSGVLSVQFFDEQVMDRAMAAGSNSVVRFARKRRQAYRTALGLEE